MKNQTAKEHYENLLAKHYSWMFGNFQDQVKKYNDWFSEQGISPKNNRKAIDLGCGSGFQSLALSSLGFEVTAVDFNRELLEELKNHDQSGTVNIIQSDILQPENYTANSPFELAVCMGDTLAHLPSLEAVLDLCEVTHNLLDTNGKFILGFRDLSGELTGTERFIPVHHDVDKIMTVFLEYGEEFVWVHDLIYIRENNSWIFEKSVYKKLRLSLKNVEILLLKAGFEVGHIQSTRGMIHIIAQKPERY